MKRHCLIPLGNTMLLFGTLLYAICIMYSVKSACELLLETRDVCSLKTSVAYPSDDTLRFFISLP